jgi:hypothetical protein
MSDDIAEFEADQLLRAIGKVQLPAPGVLEEAREALWSAVASEMLGIVPAGREEDHRTARPRQADRSKDDRKKSMGGGDPAA